MSISSEQYKAMQEYLQKVRALLYDASAFIADDFLVEAHRLVEHGEAPLGVTQLAWVISEEQIPVPKSVIRRVREYADEDEDFPDDLDKYVLEA